MADPQSLAPIELIRVLGFDGTVREGLICHPNRTQLIYPLGCNIVIEDIDKIGNCSQTILSEHNDRITCLVLSPTGKYIGSGQCTHMGFKAPVIVWDFQEKKALWNLLLHKGKVETMAFTADEKFLISVGGFDDATVVVWRISDGTPVCGCPAQADISGATFCLKTSHAYDNVFVTAGHDTLRLWTLDAPNRRLQPDEIHLTNFHRVIKCLVVCDFECPPYGLCGTTTGDILVFNMDNLRLIGATPPKQLLNQGVTSLAKVRGVMVACGVNHDGSFFELPSFELLVGSGDGRLAQYTLSLMQETPKVNKIKIIFKRRKGIEVWKDVISETRPFALTSIAMNADAHQFFVGSANSQMYRFKIADFSCDLIKTCQSKKVYDVRFPYNCTELFVTCQEEEVRVWATRTGLELKRYVVWNMTCLCIAITTDGTTIFTGWSDGVIRALGFIKEATDTMQSGDLFQKYCIRDAHNTAVTALAVTTDTSYIISGGAGGMVRIWEIIKANDPKGKPILRGHLVADLKEHKSSVSCIRMNKNDKECVSSSTDGTTIIWDIERKVRKQTVFANTLFRCVVYGAENFQVVTSGTDRQIVYWDIYTGRRIRELLGAKVGAVNTMDISDDERTLVTGGDEKMLKLWDYHRGEMTHMGLGHSAPISMARISPDMSLIISVGEDGAILFWRFPPELRGRPPRENILDRGPEEEVPEDKTPKKTCKCQVPCNKERCDCLVDLTAQTKPTAAQAGGEPAPN